MKVFVTANYMVLKDMLVEVEDGADPWNPDGWSEILDEQDVDCNLYEIWDVNEAPEE